jgi:osmotically-inducible protein OsmY
MDVALSLKNDVLRALEWEACLDAAALEVGVHDGVVTLRGHVPSYAQRWAAEQAVKRVAGVAGVANKLVVQLPPARERGDDELREAVVRTLQWNVWVPADRVSANVSSGWVTLRGEVEWEYQKASAWAAVRDLVGVCGITDLVRVATPGTAAAVKEKIEAAFMRCALLDAKRVRIEIRERKAILWGRVRSWREVEDAERAVWSAPGITEVDNLLTVEDSETPAPKPGDAAARPVPTFVLADLPPTGARAES